MSDSDGLSFSDTQSHTGSEGEMDLQPTRRRRSMAPLPKQPSLQKRKKPAQIRRRAGKAPDPFDDSSLLKPSVTMDEEMNAMKQVFLRMSEKKVKQKQERKAECKRLYKEAFHTDVEQIFRKAAKHRSKVMDKVANEIADVKAQLKTSSEQLLNAHTTYKQAITIELTQASSEIDHLRSILTDLDVQYDIAQKNIELEYQDVTETMKASLLQLEVKLTAAYADKSFYSSFRPHMERLL